MILAGFSALVFIALALCMEDVGLMVIGCALLIAVSLKSLGVFL